METTSKSMKIYHVRSKTSFYVMKCSGCGEELNGETGNFLRKRVTVHNQQIRGSKTRKLKVSEHKDNCAKNMYPKCTFFPFYNMYTESATTPGKRKTVHKKKKKKTA